MVSSCAIMMRTVLGHLGRGDNYGDDPRDLSDDRRASQSVHRSADNMVIGPAPMADIIGISRGYWNIP